MVIFRTIQASYYQISYKINQILTLNVLKDFGFMLTVNDCSLTVNEVCFSTVSAL